MVTPDVASTIDDAEVPVNEAERIERDNPAAATFREQLASTLTDMGMPRMPSRTFAALFVTDSGRLTAAELADVLAVSPAAISGAVRYLNRVGMVGRHREPGSRRDHYVVRDDTWQQTYGRRDRLLSQMLVCMRDGVRLLGDSRAGARIADSLDFFEYLQDELPKLVERWQAQRSHRAATG